MERKREMEGERDPTPDTQTWDVFLQEVVRHGQEVLEEARDGFLAPRATHLLQ